MYVLSRSGGKLRSTCCHRQMVKTFSYSDITILKNLFRMLYGILVLYECLSKAVTVTIKMSNVFLQDDYK